MRLEPDATEQERKHEKHSVRHTQRKKKGATDGRKKIRERQIPEESGHKAEHTIRKRKSRAQKYIDESRTRLRRSRRKV